MCRLSGNTEPRDQVGLNDLTYDEALNIRDGFRYDLEFLLADLLPKERFSDEFQGDLDHLLVNVYRTLFGALCKTRHSLVHHLALEGKQFYKPTT